MVLCQKKHMCKCRSNITAATAMLKLCVRVVWCSFWELQGVGSVPKRQTWREDCHENGHW